MTKEAFCAYVNMALPNSGVVAEVYRDIMHGTTEYSVRIGDDGWRIILEQGQELSEERALDLVSALILSQSKRTPESDEWEELNLISGWPRDPEQYER